MPTLNRREEYREPARKNNKEFYQSSRWHTFSRNRLKKHRLCESCLKKGITEVATQTDHIIPLTEWLAMGNDPYDESNLQSLSASCHSKKTAEENKHWNKRPEAG